MGQIGCPETSVTTILRSVTTQKSEYIFYALAEARKHTRYAFIWNLSLASLVRVAYTDVSDDPAALPNIRVHMYTHDTR